MEFCLAAEIHAHGTSIRDADRAYVVCAVSRIKCIPSLAVIWNQGMCWQSLS